MEESNLFLILKSIGIPVAYDHFINTNLENIAPPFILYRNDDASHFKADDQVFFMNKEYIVELVTDKKDINLEQTLESVLATNYLPFDKTETYIESEDIYQVTYFI